MWFCVFVPSIDAARYQLIKHVCSELDNQGRETNYSNGGKYSSIRGRLHGELKGARKAGDESNASD